jgi:predicted RND superfamily exporter protein
MSVPASPKVVQVFRRILRARVWIAGIFLILAALGIYGALRVPSDSAIETLIVPGDPVARATMDFDRLFPEGEQALLMLETADPLSPESLRAAYRLEQKLAKIAHVEAHSLLDLYQRADSAQEISAADAAKLRSFATGTPMFRRAGLLGCDYLGIGRPSATTH